MVAHVLDGLVWAPNFPVSLGFHPKPSGGGELLADAGAGAGGDEDGGSEDEATSNAGAGAEAFVEEKDAEDGADEGFHVEQHAGLGGGNLSHAPIPEQCGGSSAEQAAGSESQPGAE